MSWLRAVPAALQSLVAAVAAMMVWALQGDRGLNLWALGHVRLAQGVNAWMNGDVPHGVEHVFRGDIRYYPGPAMLDAILFGSSRLEWGLRLLTLTAAGLVVASVWVMTERLSGRAAAWMAACALSFHPWMVSAATVPTPTAFMLAGILVPTALVVCAQRRTWLWTLSMITSLAVGLLSSPHVWLWLACLFVLLFVDMESEVGPGEVGIRSVHIGELSVIPLAMALAVAVHPWWSEEPLKHVGLSLRDWMRMQPEPMLWFGSRYGADRIPVLATLSGPLLWLPSVWMLFTLAGVARAVTGIRRHPARWLPPLFVLGATLVLLWSMRTMWHAGVDLRVLVVAATLPLSVSGAMWAAGAMMGLRDSGRGGIGTLSGRMTGVWILLASVSLVSLVESAPAWRAAESWHSSLLGGTRGAAARGMWRNPHAPVPAAWVSQWMSVSGRWVIPVNDWEWHRVVDYYVETGRVAAPVEWSSLEVADLGLMVFEDAAPEFHAVWSEYQRLERGGRVLGRWMSADGTVLAAAVWLGTGDPP